MKTPYACTGPDRKAGMTTSPKTWPSGSVGRSASASPQDRILLVGSSGGHLAQLMALRSWWGEHERAWCTFSTPDAHGHLADELDVTWAHAPTTRNVLNLLRNHAVAWRLLRRFKPTVIVSTGAGVALPFFIIGKALHIRTVYLEVFDRIDSATLTGRLCLPFTDVMCVQWPEQAGLYDQAHVIGPVL